MLSKASKKLALPGVYCVSKSRHCPECGISIYFRISLLLRHLARQGGAHSRKNNLKFEYQKLKDLIICAVIGKDTKKNCVKI